MRMSRARNWSIAIAALLVTLIAFDVGVAFADAPPPAAPDLAQRVADLEAYMGNGAPKFMTTTPGPGHNAWMMTSAALVLFMTLPGLALFYGGLVRKKNVLSVLAQCLGCAGIVSIIWFTVGYSLCFTKGTPFIGGLGAAFLKGVSSAPNGDYAAWVSQNVFSMFQMMFAIITPALIVGAIAERMKYSAIMAFIVVWMFVVYFPLAHMTWGADGLMNGVWNASASIKAIDFAGGTVVHMSSGWSALILCLILGKRTGYDKRAFLPHSLTLTMVGTGMLWVGWYGFNAGSAVASDAVAANAFTTTTIAAAVAATVWPLLEWITRGKPSVLGFCSGAVAGLVVITPAAGFVTPASSLIIGVLAGAVPFLACTKLKAFFKYDDALDTFGVHGVGGTMGAFVTGIFATPEVNGNLNTNLAAVLAGKTLWLEQLKSIGLTLTLSIVGTTVIAYAVKAVLGLRPSLEAEELGLDDTDHGEAGYHPEEMGVPGAELVEDAVRAAAPVVKPAAT